MKTVLITGATDGLGKGVAHALAKEGYVLLLHGRNPQKGEKVLAEIENATGNRNLSYYNADFESLYEAEALAKEILGKYKHLDVLVNNAGIGVLPKRLDSRDGLELVFQVDCLAPYILMKKLIPLLSASAPSRIVNVASGAQAEIDFSDPLLEKDWDGLRSYFQAKLALIMVSFEMAKAYETMGVTVNALHPATMMPTKMIKGMFEAQSTLEDGINSVIKAATDPQLEKVTGRYFDQTTEAKALAQAYDDKARKKLMELAKKLTGV